MRGNAPAFAGDETAPALAVLPFEHLSAEHGEAHFTAGVNAEIVSQLSQLSELRLMSPAAKVSQLSQLSELRLMSPAAIAAAGEGPDRVARLAVNNRWPGCGNRCATNTRRGTCSSSSRPCRH